MLNDGKPVGDINKTIITLIPKADKPEKASRKAPAKPVKEDPDAGGE